MNPLDCTLERFRVAIVQAIEAIEDGAPEMAAAFLGSALEEPITRPHSCGVCGACFQWPGELADHEWRIHEYLGEDEPYPQDDDEVAFVNEELAQARELDREAGAA
jgi:hypothetical protein